MNNKEKKIEGGILEETEHLIRFTGDDGAMIAFKKVYDVYDSIKTEDDIHRELRIASKITELESQLKNLRSIVEQLTRR